MGKVVGFQFGFDDSVSRDERALRLKGLLPKISRSISGSLRARSPIDALRCFLLAFGVAEKVACTFPLGHSKFKSEPLKVLNLKPTTNDCSKIGIKKNLI